MSNNPILEKFYLNKKTVLVTGASRGLGRRFSYVLSTMGANVVLAARDKDKLSETKEIIKQSNGECIAVNIDVNSEDSINNAFEKAEEKYGEVSILINNAGIAISKSTLKTSVEDWDKVINTNLRGVFACSKAFANRLVNKKIPGKIVNISSIAAEIVLGNYLSSYCASKAAVSHLTRTLAFEYAKYNIQVNAIAPGYILTDLNKNFFDTMDGKEMIKSIPQKRLGKPEELDGALLLLCSELGSFMTGSVIRVDGGHVIS
jgi:NAD(P)-dependent dehydrogenase (short-subunit alcohol dehydrogenase family)